MRYNPTALGVDGLDRIYINNIISVNEICIRHNELVTTNKALVNALAICKEFFDNNQDIDFQYYSLVKEALELLEVK